MISRRTASALGAVYQSAFTSGKTGSLRSNDLYDFLFENDFPAWLNARAKRLKGTPRQLKDFIMQLHTGETQSVVSHGSATSMESMGQDLLRKLAEAVLNWRGGLEEWRRNLFEKDFRPLLSSLELDGYIYRDGRLLASESTILDTEEAGGVLERLYTELSLAKKDVAFHCLKLSEDHYRDGNWDDCVSNARRFLECVLMEVAAHHSLRYTAKELEHSTYTAPGQVRVYLRDAGLLDEKERKALAEDYGFFSEKGSHPYIAQDRHARLCRQHALILAEFMLFSYEAFLATVPAKPA